MAIGRRSTLGRRAVLRGIGGAAVALPFLEIMGDSSAHADPMTLPKRYVVCFGGHSLGCDGDPTYLFDPGQNGALPDALSPLAPVQGDVSVVTGMAIPASPQGSTAPAGGRTFFFHGSEASPLLSGVRCQSTAAFPGEPVYGPTSDQIVATAIGGATPFPSLQVRVQAIMYIAMGGTYIDVMSWGASSGGAIVPLAPQASPRGLFDALFSNFQSQMATPEEQQQKAFLLRSRLSVLDLVRDSTQRLVARLGGADQRRLQQHLDEIRDLEKQLAAPPPAQTGGCTAPADPGPDPPLGGTSSGRAYDSTDVNMGYSDEDSRARSMCDLVHMALVCDLTRVVSLMFTDFHCGMNMFVPLGSNPRFGMDLHSLTHVEGDPSGLLAGIRWHMKHFGYLVGKMKGTPEGSGTLLDQSALVYLCEGGHGIGGVNSQSSASYTPHSTDNMGCLIAGHAGGLNSPAKQVAATGSHPAQALLTAMNAVGVDASALGEVTGTIPGL